VVSGLSLNGSGRYLIPESVLAVVLDLLDLIGEDLAQLEAGEEWLRIRSEKVDFVTGRLVYDFPDVMGVMVKKGKAQKVKLSVPRQTLVTAVMVASTAEEEGKVVLSVEGNTMRVESESAQMRALMDFEVGASLEGRWERLFVGELLKEMLGAFAGDEIEFKISAEEGEDRLYVEDGKECAVLMPMTR
jgi:DNA polymerase III sliding clamp (beta) subunit (PCNA family)